MSEQDHFSAALDERTAEHHDPEAEHDGVEDIESIEDQPKKKKSIPTPVIIVGGMVVFIACAFGYKHFFGVKPNNQFASAPVTTLPPDTGGMIPSTPAQSSASRPPLPAQGMPTQIAGVTAAQLPDQASGPIGPVPVIAGTPTAVPVPPTAAAQLPLDTGASASTPNTVVSNQPASTSAAVTTPNAPAIDTAASAPATGVVIANGVTTPDAKDLEIKKLRQELKDARTHHGAKPRHVPIRAVKADAASDAADNASDGEVKKVVPNTRNSARNKRGRVEVQLGFHIKQIIPGQGWVEEEDSGKQRVVTVGDKLGNAEVTKIDPDNYKIYTTAGVIQ